MAKYIQHLRAIARLQPDEVLENDARLFVSIRRVTPDIEITPMTARFRAPRFLKPLMLIGGVVQHEFRNDAKPTTMRLAQKILEILQAAVGRMDRCVVRNIVAVIFPRRRTERQNPDNCDSEILDVIQLLCETGKISHPVIHAVIKRSDVNLVDDGILVPEWVALKSSDWLILRHPVVLSSIPFQ